MKYKGNPQQPYKAVKAHNEASTVTLKLPPALVAWRISPTFHTRLVQKFVANNDELFPKWDMKSFYNLSQDNEQEWLVEEITSHHWSNSKELKLEVRWMLGDTTCVRFLHFIKVLIDHNRTLTRYIWYQWYSKMTVVMFYDKEYSCLSKLWSHACVWQSLH